MKLKERNKRNMRKIISNKYLKNIICIMLSCLSLLYINATLKSDHSLFEFSNSIYSLIAFVGVLLLIIKAIEKIKEEKNNRLLIISSILGLIFSIFMVSGRNILLLDTVEIGKIKTWIKFLCGIPFWSPIIILLLTFRPKTRIETKSRFGTINSQKYFLICWGIIFGIWFLGLIASYPGVYGYDCIYQMHWYMNREILSQHPYIHTYLLGFCTWTLGKLLGNYEKGFFIYSIIQMLILSSSFAYICLYLRKRNVNRVFRIVTIMLMAVLPCNIIMSFSGTKDIIYAAMVVYLTVMLLYTIEDPQKLKSIKWIIALIIVFFLQSVFRSQGIYITVLTSILLILFSKKHKKVWTVILGSVLVLFVIYQGPLAKACHVKKIDSIHEMMSVPCVQLSRVYIHTGTELSASEKREIKKYVPNCTQYSITSQGIADSVKNTFNSKAFKENPKEFIQLYIKMGEKYPGYYLDAWTRLSLGNWYPDMNYRDPAAYHPYWEYDMMGQVFWPYQDNALLLHHKTPHYFGVFEKGLEKTSKYNVYQKIPVISQLFSGGLTVWIMLFFICWCIYHKRYKYIFSALIVLFIWLTLLLGPVVLFRYLYPVYACTPIWIGIMLTSEKDEKIIER